MISLYFHLPFCSRKCDYCHFFVLPNRDDLKAQFINALELEWRLRSPLLENKEIVSIYFGGGTPSLMPPKQLAKILDWISSYTLSPNLEITLEANPENISYDLMHEFQSVGINRVSIGLQSLEDDLLHRLGRTHNTQEAIQSVILAEKAGIRNISIDLMYDLPGQTLSHWQRTLQQALLLPITHLSLYNLTIEPHTGFYKHREALSSIIPDEDTSLQMYNVALQKIENAGLQQYEISAFAREGFSSKHNTGYWTARPFIGFGPSAFSYWEGRRFRNICSLNRYHKALLAHQDPIDFEECLSLNAHQNELLAIQIRLREGVDLEAFENTHGQLPQETMQSIQSLVSQGLLEFIGMRLKLTSKGILFYDTVATELI